VKHIDAQSLQRKALAGAQSLLALCLLGNSERIQRQIAACRLAKQQELFAREPSLTAPARGLSYAGRGAGSAQDRLKAEAHMLKAFPDQNKRVP
jgi:hypothetical protein